MSKELEMNMMGELKCFFGLQITQDNEGIFINQAKYVKDLHKRFGIDKWKTESTLMKPFKKALVFSSYIDVDAVKNISRHVDLTNDVCNIHLYA